MVRISTTAGRVTGAQARAQRPRVAGKLFTGRAASDAAPLAGALFAICGRSQSIAAAAAIEAAKGEGEREAQRRARDVRIAAETVHEHAWRLLVDWPKLAGRAPEVEALAGARKALAPLLAAAEGEDLRDAARGAQAWAGQAIFGTAPADFLAVGSTMALRKWARKGDTNVARLVAEILEGDPALGASDVAFLPPGDVWVARDLASALDDAAFDDTPHWHGEARETGPLARTAAHPLVADAIAAWGRGVGARLAARLVEMALALESMSQGRGAGHGAARLDGASAIAWVETARGLLVHQAALDGERICAYRIVAPTEWNFHPAGAFARGALGMPAADAGRLERQVRWLVASLDPCVGVSFEAHHA